MMTTLLPILAGLVVIGTAFVLYVGPEGSPERRVKRNPPLAGLVQIFAVITATMEAFKRAIIAAAEALKPLADAFAALDEKRRQ